MFPQLDGVRVYRTQAILHQPRNVCEAITKRVGYSVQLGLNYISEIYARFDLTKEEWPKTTERKERLRIIAQEAGFV